MRFTEKIAEIEVTPATIPVPEPIPMPTTEPAKTPEPAKVARDSVLAAVTAWEQQVLEAYRVV